ncbi:MAG TPA: PSD1 and planctomycete cytochrome C domain-containing protein, partial [Gemmataceae bacterium]|nr:PSD1 and planctomycete cytochrome C domain-containing protein [Gemmataceae bacterium]
MSQRSRLGFSLPGLSVLLIAGLPGAAAEPKPAPVDFSRDVRPILSKNCFACHGPDAAGRASKLRLDRRESAIRKPAEGLPAITPGNPDKSELVWRISAPDEGHRMPPKDSGHRLTPRQIVTLKSWIEQGAPYAEHWAFVKPVRPALPPVSNPAWCRNGIDRFVLARLEKAGLKPSPEADRFALLRRVSLDLRGLPPSPQEVEAFAHDPSPDAYEKAVERFLADPAFGERWARMWLDLARYADSAGYGSDPLRPNLWPYRDWVINAFNRNLPYDQFTLWQIAGDLLPGATQEQKVATAFHRNTMTNTEGGTDREEFRVAAVKDRVDTTAQVWMGLTLGCAKCHSHKYDPITQKEYYRFFAVFNQTADNDQPDERPTMPLLKPEQQEEARRIDADLAAAGTRQAALAAVVALRRVPAPVESLAGAVEVARLRRARPVPTNLPVMVELPPDKRRVTHLMKKGNFLDPGDKVEPGVPAAFHPLPKGAAADRLGVAKWLVDPDNPLTARVAVNRFWAQLWGTGLVETEEDFGTQGDLPSHPQLLDWLACEFMGGASGGVDPRRGGWDVKQLLRLMVTSAAYRQ